MKKDTRQRLNLRHGVPIWLVAMVSSVLLSGAASQVHAAPASVVIGQSIGKIKLGMSRQTVLRLLGRPTKAYQRYDGLKEDSWISKPPGGSEDETADDNHLNVIYQGGGVIQIEATAPTFITDGGTNVRTPLSNLVRRFKHLRASDYAYDLDNGGYHNLYFDSVRSGLAFEFAHYQDYLVPDSQPSALIVHRPGRRVLPGAGGKYQGKPQMDGKEGRAIMRLADG